jgi:hypothetical protein
MRVRLRRRVSLIESSILEGQLTLKRSASVLALGSDEERFGMVAPLKPWPAGFGRLDS